MTKGQSLMLPFMFACVMVLFKVHHQGVCGPNSITSTSAMIFVYVTPLGMVTDVLHHPCTTRVQIPCTVCETTSTTLNRENGTRSDRFKSNEAQASSA